MRIMNLTPHDISFCDENGRVILKLPTSGIVARVRSKIETVGYVEVGDVGIPVKQTVFGEVENVPDPEDGVVYLCSSIVQMNSDRDDILSPDTTGAGAVRDRNGRIIGSKGMQRID